MMLGRSYVSSIAQSADALKHAARIHVRITICHDTTCQQSQCCRVDRAGIQKAHHCLTGHAGEGHRAFRHDGHHLNKGLAMQQAVT
eukprot:6454901-Amphidinium_carterae.1